MTRYWEYWKSVLEPFYKSGQVIRIHSKIDGLPLQGVFYRCQSPQNTGNFPLPSNHNSNPNQVVMIVPGRTEGSLKYTETCFDLVQRGYSVLVFGHRGQGFSGRLLPNTQVGHVEQFDDYVTDLNEWYSLTQSHSGSQALHIVAHSMGALVTSAWLEQRLRNLVSVTFTSPMTQLNLGKIPPSLLKILLQAKCFFGQSKEFAVKPGELDLKTYGVDLTNCKERLEWYRTVLSEFPELQLGYPSNQWLYSALKIQAEWTKVRFSHLLQKYHSVPFLVIEAENDLVVKPSSFRELSQHLSNLESHVVKSAQHDLFIETDEVRKTVLGKLLNLWKHKKEV